MHPVVPSLAILAAALLLVDASHAQTPSVPAAIPFDIPYGSPIALEQARSVLAAAEAEARRRNWKYAIAIVDSLGELVSFDKMDGTQLASVRIAEAKARAAAQFRRPTKIFQDAVNGGQAASLSLPGVVAGEGGVPLIVDGKLIGAIGTSGGTAPQDGVVAQAGVDKLK